MLNFLYLTLVSKNRLQSIILSVFVFCLCSPFAFSQEFKLIALFKDKAMVMVDGKRVLLHKNKKNRYKLLLLSANSDRAIIRFNGVDSTYKLNMLISTSFSKREHTEVVLWANNQNMFTSSGKINGKRVFFLVDTGATAVALSEAQAKQLGIRYKNAQKGFAQTAAHVVKTWRIKLNSVELGGIKVRNVPAIIISGNQRSPILLGMTFLSKVKMVRSGKKMSLLKKN